MVCCCTSENFNFHSLLFRLTFYGIHYAYHKYYPTTILIPAGNIMSGYSGYFYENDNLSNSFPFDTSIDLMPYSPIQNLLFDSVDEIPPYYDASYTLGRDYIIDFGYDIYIFFNHTLKTIRFFQPYGSLSITPLVPIFPKILASINSHYKINYTSDYIICYN